MDFKEMASKMYDSAIDFDWLEYAEYREGEEEGIANALRKIEAMAKDDIDFTSLLNVLIAIF